MGYDKNIYNQIVFLGENGLNHQMECSILSSIDKEKRPTFNASIKDEAGNNMISLVPEYPAILPIRTLKLKETNPSLWNRVDLLMDHSEDITPEQQEKIQVSSFYQLSRIDIMKNIFILNILIFLI